MRRLGRHVRSATVRVSEKGLKVRVLEALPFIGCRTSSWDEKGMHIESGFHRYVGFYMHIPELLEKVGNNLDELFCREDEVEIRHPDGTHATLGLSGTVKDSRTVVIPHDFFSLTRAVRLCGLIRLLLYEGLVLAGGYTNQPYPATMEGAVFSGTFAAQHVRDEAAC